MFFSENSEILGIAARTGCSIFVLPETEAADFLRKNNTRSDMLVLAPEEKKIITIEQVKTVLSRLLVRQAKDFYVVISPAEALGEEAANAFLKSLEEPGEKVHFVLLTGAASRILPTILSRSQVYFLKNQHIDFDNIVADEKVKTLARRLISAKPADLPQLADDIIPKTKEKTRDFVLSVIGVAIEMLYKSYFKTGKETFLAKIPKFIALYENIDKNGHIKLHLVADLL